MSGSIRVLTADDSAVMRRILHEVISADADLQAVASAENGEHAIELFRSEHPDVVLLDVEMPIINGPQAARSIRAMDLAIPIVLYCPATVRAGDLALEALTLGAADLLTRPMESGHVHRVIDTLSRELIPMLRFWGRTSREFLPASPLLTAQSADPRDVQILLIIASAWSISAVQKILTRLPGDLSIPVLIMVSMPRPFSQCLAARLDRIASVNVIEAVDGTLIQPGRAHLVSSQLRLELESTTESLCLAVTEKKSESSAGGVDDLLMSTAKNYSGRCLTIVLNGPSADGVTGCRYMKQAGTEILVQNSTGQRAWELPRTVMEANLAKQILSIEELQSAIRHRLPPAG